ncbi:DNA break repair nuclease [Podila epicladia]|nr:DNA break repair nuclease [Podila epicladia]
MDKRKLASLEPTTHDGTVIKPPTTTRAVSTTDGFNQRPGPPADLQKDSFEKECPLQAERLERQAQAFVSFQQHVQETFSDSQSDHTHTTIQDGRKLGQSHGRSRSSLVSLDATNSSQSSETQFFTMQSEHDYNPDCNEEQDPQCKDEEFADLCLDEIEDWGDDFDIEHEPPGCAPVPDVACPLCGLDLSALDTMTPDAHVNRCLDGTGVESQNLPDQTEIPSILPNVASQLRTGNPISSILGSIRSVITNLPLRPYLPPPSTPTTATPKPPPKQSKPKTYRPCPFYKKMPDTDFTVDAFMYGAVEGCGAYFLSHFHSDHYGGLTSTWSHGLIYCSSITANLVISRLRVDEKWVRRLPMHKPTLVNGVTVTLMDANHCPGSVLFVFDLHSPKRRYLHTGDFRALPDMCLDPILCQPPNVPIDILYLDTTYSNPRYTFPSQKLVISETVRTINKELGLVNDTVVPPKPAPAKKANIMESWLKRESGNAQKLVTMSTKPTKMSKSAADWSRQMETNKVVICVGTYLIGKERVWMAVAKALRSKVFVQPAKLQILSCLEDQEIIDMLTCNPREAQVHLMHMGSDMSPESLQEYLDKLSPTFTRLIAIRPTGWTFSGGPKKDSVSTTDITPEQTPTTLQLRPSYTSPMVKIYPVPYSEHSSFNELAGFVRSLNIMRIIPTVGVGSEKGRHAMSEWFDRWEQERRKGIGWL